MAYDFDKAVDSPSFSPADTGPLSDGTPAPARSPLSRVGSEQISSPTQTKNFRHRLFSSDSHSSVASSVPLPPNSPPDISGNVFHLADFFPPLREPRIQYSDLEIHEISRCLKFTDHHRWSDAPRLYIVLHTIGQLHLLDAVLNGDFSDLCFPFSRASVPELLDSGLRVNFLEAQQLVLTKAVDLEHGSKRHTHFGKDDAFPFEIRGKLGRGGFGIVDKIFNPLSRREFARKRFRRDRGHKKDEVENFKNELQVLKRIDHDHCIKLVASYTDSKYFGLIMSPVADCNMADFCSQTPDDPTKLSTLRPFYGCLASALQYLHHEQIRHRDIKPENILVKGDWVYLTDFGTSLSWESLGRSTTTEDTGKSWMYCAPEVARYEPRNWSSDIWSLGCVFLEMTTVLKGRSITDMRGLFMRLHESRRFYQCKAGIDEWLRELRTSGSVSDSLPLRWTSCMLRIDPQSRPSAEYLYRDVVDQAHSEGTGTLQFIGDCCLEHDVEESDSDIAALSESDSDSYSDTEVDEAVSPLTPASKSAHIADRCIKSVEAEDEIDPVNSSIEPFPLVPLSPTAHETATRGSLIRPAFTAGDAAQSPGATSQLENPSIAPYSSISTAHDKEAVQDLRIDTGLQQNKGLGPQQSPTIEGFGLDFIHPAAQNATVETPLLPPRITMDQEVKLDDIEVDVVVRDGEEGDPNVLVAEMTAALLASRSRRASTASDMPASRRPGDAMSPTNGNLQSLSGWQTVGLVNNLPVLTPFSWIKPSQLLNDVRSDTSFMTFLETNYRDCFDMVSASTIEDVTLLVEMLLRNGLKIDSWKYVDEEGISPLFRVLEWGENFQALFKIVVNSGANLQYETTDGRSPLIQAAGYGHIWAIKILVDAGADPKNDTRRVAMVDAAENGQLETVKYLTETLEVSPDSKGADKRTALRAASMNGYVEIISFLLETFRDNVDIESKVNDQSILYDACVGGKIEVVEILLKHGADPNTTSGKKTGKWTPLIRAVQASNMVIVQALVNHGAKVSIKTLPLFSGAGPLGTTATIEAKKCGNTRIVKYLQDQKKMQAPSKGHGRNKKKNKVASSHVEKGSAEE